jgi:hypothetical protein
MVYNLEYIGSSVYWCMVSKMSGLGQECTSGVEIHPVLSAAARGRRLLLLTSLCASCSAQDFWLVWGLGCGEGLWLRVKGLGLYSNLRV